MSERWFFYNNEQCAVNEDGTSSGLVSAHQPILDFLDAGGVIEPEFQVSLTPDKNPIAADGVDEAVISVTWLDSTQAAPASVMVDVAGESEEVTLSAGAGSLSPIAAGSACGIKVSAPDYRAAPITITAE